MTLAPYASKADRDIDLLRARLFDLLWVLDDNPSAFTADHLSDLRSRIGITLDQTVPRPPVRHKLVPTGDHARDRLVRERLRVLHDDVSSGPLRYRRVTD
jgi:hypothetical protein